MPFLASAWADWERSRTVTLHKGGWYNFWDDTVVAGGQQVTLAASP